MTPELQERSDWKEDKVGDFFLNSCVGRCLTSMQTIMIVLVLCLVFAFLSVFGECLFISK
jgi:hypothetical protein